uniref:Uncharacterized protein n=1 Tax=Opuntia streptacantha TaxID=393608 RepID=A0A7C8ZL88_OPUST
MVYETSNHGTPTCHISFFTGNHVKCFPSIFQQSTSPVHVNQTTHHRKVGVNSKLYSIGMHLFPIRSTITCSTASLKNNGECLIILFYSSSSHLSKNPHNLIKMCFTIIIYNSNIPNPSVAMICHPNLIKEDRVGLW